MILADWNITSILIDVIAVVLVFTFLLVFFLTKKNYKPLIMYSIIFVLYITVVVIDIIFNAEIARSAIEIFTIFACVALAIVYQNDIKAIFFNLQRHHEKNSTQDASYSDEELRVAVDEIIKACQTMSKARTGALIVIAPTSVATHVLKTGVELGALVSSALLESIFNTRAPFHDGAVIIKGNRVLSAGCFLPLSQTQSVAKNLGTRHRAGIGITEETDMLTIIVSEETGVISIASKGELRRFVTPDRLRDILHETYKIARTTKSRSII